MSAGAARARGEVEIQLAGAGRYRETRDPALAAWLGEMVAALAPAADSLAVRFTGDRVMRTLNRDFRGLDRTTDVLSFPGGRSPEGNHLGDIVLSMPRVRRQAEEAGHPAAREIRILLLHGVLHCLGYDHENDRGEMDRIERRLRRRWIAR